MTYSNKPPLKQAAFTLIELIIIVVILAILGSYIITRFSSNDKFEQDSIAAQIISTGQLARQLSMGDSSRDFVFSVQSNQVSILVDGNPLTLSNISFPINFGTGATLSPTTNISFDALGTTTATTINLQTETSINICFEASGFIHRC